MYSTCIFPVSVVMSLAIVLVTGSNILMMPYLFKSHVRMFSIVGKDLESRGHNVHILVEEAFRSIVDDVGVPALTYQGGDGYMEALDELATNIDLLNIAIEDTRVKNKLCENVHSDAEFMDRMTSLAFDLVLIDGFDCNRCFYTIPYRLGVRYITLTARNDPWNAGIPALPAVEPVLGFGRGFSTQSTLFERTINLLTNIKWWMLVPSKTLDESMISRFCPNRPRTSFAELFKKSEMWLVNLDQICLNDHTISAPHYQMIAGLTLKQAEPLPAALESFVESSPNGVIVFTLGSFMDSVPDEMLFKLLNAFRRLNYSIIMRHSNTNLENVPDNVKLLPWLPQHDLLAHPKTRAFITHAGGNGQLEALYHGVPMISFPMFADQHYNARIVARKGFGVTLDPYTFTSDEALQAINDVASNTLYRDNIKRCSDRFRSLPSARDTIAFWVEHIIKYGGEHLRPAAIDVPIWKLFMLDIVALGVFLILLTLSCGFLVCMKLCGKFGNEKQNPKKNE